MSKFCQRCGQVEISNRGHFCPACAAKQVKESDMKSKAIRRAANPPPTVPCACGCGRSFTRINGRHKYAPECPHFREKMPKVKEVYRRLKHEDAKTKTAAIALKADQEINRVVDNAVVDAYTKAGPDERERIMALNPRLRWRLVGL